MTEKTLTIPRKNINIKEAIIGLGLTSQFRGSVSWASFLTVPLKDIIVKALTNNVCLESLLQHPLDDKGEVNLSSKLDQELAGTIFNDVLSRAYLIKNNAHSLSEIDNLLSAPAFISKLSAADILFATNLFARNNDVVFLETLMRHVEHSGMNIDNLITNFVDQSNKITPESIDVMLTFSEVHQKLKVYLQDLVKNHIDDFYQILKRSAGQIITFCKKEMPQEMAGFVQYIVEDEETLTNQFTENTSPEFSGLLLGYPTTKVSFENAIDNMLQAEGDVLLQLNDFTIRHFASLSIERQSDVKKALLKVVSIDRFKEDPTKVGQTVIGMSPAIIKYYVANAPEELNGLLSWYLTNAEKNTISKFVNKLIIDHNYDLLRIVFSNSTTIKKLDQIELLNTLATRIAKPYFDKDYYQILDLIIEQVKVSKESLNANDQKNMVKIISDMYKKALGSGDERILTTILSCNFQKIQDINQESETIKLIGENHLGCVINKKCDTNNHQVSFTGGSKIIKCIPLETFAAPEPVFIYDNRIDSQSTKNGPNHTWKDYVFPHNSLEGYFNPHSALPVVAFAVDLM
jgi:hypothetical protein